jgi:hypothetical protein
MGQGANEAPRRKPRAIYRNQPNTLSSIGHFVVEGSSTSSITVESLRIPGVLGARKAAGYEPQRNQMGNGVHVYPDTLLKGAGSAVRQA